MAIVLGDLHFGKKGFNKNLLNVQLTYLDTVIDFMLNNSENKLILTGDVFDHPSKIDVECLNIIMERFFDKLFQHEIKVYYILGNHDIYYKTSLDTYLFKPFEKFYTNVQVIKKPTILYIDGVDWELHPWILPNQDFKINSRRLIGHFEINGFRMTNTFRCQFGIQTESLKECEKVLSGHFHTLQDEEIITYVGTPYWLDWNDKNQKKGFWTLHGKNLEFHENTKSPKFIEIEERETGRFYLNGSEVFESDIKRIAEETPYLKLNVHTKESIENLELNDYTVIDFVEQSDEEINIDEKVDSFVQRSLSDEGYIEFNELYRKIESEIPQEED